MNQLASNSYRGIPAFALTLHGWKQKFPAEKLLPLLSKHFAVAGVPLQEVDVKGDSPTNLKSVSGRTLHKRIASGEFYGLTTLCGYHFFDRRSKGSHDFIIDVSDGYGDQHACFVNAVTAISNRKEMAFDWLRDMLAIVSPAYGYSLEMPLGDDPVLYSLGMFARTEHRITETEAWQDASHARIGGDLHWRGRFRHVFAVNILSPPHLDNRIDGQPLANWINHAGLGIIEQWKRDVWVWQVPREQRIKAANILQFNGLLTAPKGFENELIG